MVLCTKCGLGGDLVVDHCELVPALGTAVTPGGSFDDEVERCQLASLYQRVERERGFTTGDISE